MKVFYHGADLDGKCSAAIINKHYKNSAYLNDGLGRPQFIPINYGTPLKWEKLTPGETICVVDFSFPREDMLTLHFNYNLIWIDHHVTALKELEDYENEIQGLRREGIGACQLVWEHFFRKEDLPYVVQLLAEYDVWYHEDPNTLPFQSGANQTKHEPVHNYTDFWEPLLQTGATKEMYDLVGKTDQFNKFTEVLSKGNVILEYETNKHERLAQGVTFEMFWEGYNFIVGNAIGVNSHFFNSVWDEEKHDAMLVFSFRKNKWVVSMYCPPELTDKQDLSVIAKKYGGGGHKGACGFQCSELPFSLPKEM